MGKHGTGGVLVVVGLARYLARPLRENDDIWDARCQVLLLLLTEYWTTNV